MILKHGTVLERRRKSRRLFEGDHLKSYLDLSYRFSCDIDGSTAIQRLSLVGMNH